MSAPPFYLSSRVATIEKVTVPLNPLCECTVTVVLYVVQSDMFFSISNFTFQPSLADGVLATIYQRFVMQSGVSCNLKEKVTDSSILVIEMFT